MQGRSRQRNNLRFERASYLRAVAFQFLKLVFQTRNHQVSCLTILSPLGHKLNVFGFRLSGLVRQCFWHEKETRFLRVSRALKSISMVAIFWRRSLATTEFRKFAVGWRLSPDHIFANPQNISQFQILNFCGLHFLPLRLWSCDFFGQETAISCGRPEQAGSLKIINSARDVRYIL